MSRTGMDEGGLSVSDPEAASDEEPVDDLGDDLGEEPGDEPPEPADEGLREPVDTAAEVAAAQAADEDEVREAEEAEASSGPGPGDALSDDELLQGVTALIYASPDPLGTGRLVKLLERPRTARVKAALVGLGERLEATGLPIELRLLAGGWQIVTRSSMGAVVARLFQERKAERISAAALETLAIVAYRQPVTKAEIEAIRGVQAGPILRNLVDRGLVRVTGRADQPGHPLQYGTTRSFLDRFGLGSLEELPRDGELAGDG